MLSKTVCFCVHAAMRNTLAVVWQWSYGTKAFYGTNCLELTGFHSQQSDKQTRYLRFVVIRQMALAANSYMCCHFVDVPYYISL